MKDILRVVMGEDGRKKSRGVMPIIGWVNPSVNTYMTAAADRKRVSHEELYRRYEEYRGAGFNMVFCMGTAVGASDDGLVEEILEICEKLELGCLLIDAQTYSRPFTEKRLQELYDFASKYASFKGLMVYDEPNVSAFPTLAQNYVMFRKYFPDKLFYVNLLPNYATDEQLGTDNYAKYVAEYAKMVKQGYLSYDHYPFIHFEIGIVNNDKYFKNLSVIRRQSLQSRVPFMVFVEVTAFVSHAHIPNREEIFWQVNTALAYGARGIQYFTYGMPEDTSETFSGAVIARDGTRTASYDAVREIILGCATAHPLAVASPAPAVVLDAYDSSAVRLSVRVWTLNENYWTVYFDLMDGLTHVFEIPEDTIARYAGVSADELNEFEKSDKREHIERCIAHLFVTFMRDSRFTCENGLWVTKGCGESEQKEENQ